MEKEITLPRPGETMEKCNISKCLIKENDSFEIGDLAKELDL